MFSKLRIPLWLYEEVQFPNEMEHDTGIRPIESIKASSTKYDSIGWMLGSCSISFGNRFHYFLVRDFAEQCLSGITC